jgi:hypothetical protein
MSVTIGDETSLLTAMFMAPLTKFLFMQFSRIYTPTRDHSLYKTAIKKKEGGEK